MSERDELAKDIRNLGITVIDGPPVDLSEPLAQHLHNLGYRKPRTITTTEELDTLPDGVIIMDGRGNCREGLRTMGGGNVWRAMGPAKVLRSKEIWLPATVLHEGSAA